MELRGYQKDLIEKTRASFRRGKKAPLICSPCGSGKTILFSYFTSESVKKNNRVLILAHRKELIEQISDTLNIFDVDHGFIVPGRPFDPTRFPVLVASVFSAVRRIPQIPPPDFIIIDECHHLSTGSTWGKLLAAFPDAFKVGVTATPRRLSGEPLTDFFDDLIMGPTVQELINLKALVPYKLFIPSTIDVSGVSTRGGDFAAKELSLAVEKSCVVGDAVQQYQKHANGKRAIAFCPSVENAQMVASRFTAAGFLSECLDGTLTREVRAEMIRRYRSNIIIVLTSCNIISEGFNMPAIECAISLSPTKSLCKYLQTMGRALRPHPGKEYAILLDHAGNTNRFGLPCEVHNWTLQGSQRRKKSDAPSVRTCPQCYFAQYPGKPACENCGYVFEIKPRKVEQQEGELIEVDPETFRKNARKQQGGAQTLQDLINLGKSRNYRNAYKWAQHIFQARQRKKLQRGW